MITPTLASKSPYECLFQFPPKFLKLYNFGCLSYPWLRPYNSHKARLVANGFQQRPGLDYTDTFSHMVRPVTVHTIITLATTKG